MYVYGFFEAEEFLCYFCIIRLISKNFEHNWLVATLTNNKFLLPTNWLFRQRKLYEISQNKYVQSRFISRSLIIIKYMFNSFSFSKSSLNKKLLLYSVKEGERNTRLIGSRKKSRIRNFARLF